MENTDWGKLEPVLKAFKWLNFRIFMPIVYSIGALRPIDKKKAVVVEVRAASPDKSFDVITEALKNDGYHCSVSYMRWQTGKETVFLKNSYKMLWNISNAAAVLICEACNVMGTFKKRRGTIVVNLWHGCGAFKKFGYSTADSASKWGAGKAELDRYPLYGNIDYFTVSSPEVIWAYREATHIDERKIIPCGISRTDVFFDEKFKSAAGEKLRDSLGDCLGNRKVILYAPTFRGRLKKAAATRVDYALMSDLLSDEYVIVVKQHPFVKDTLIDKQLTEEKRVFDYSDKMTIDELMCACDICVTDYSSLIFEYSLLKKPLYFLAYDLDEYNDFRGFYYPYESLTMGNICRNEMELVKRIKNEKEFDYFSMDAFREKFMRSCDGHSTERIMKLIKQEVTR